jgi:hypothetical protein
MSKNGKVIHGRLTFPRQHEMKFFWYAEKRNSLDPEKTVERSVFQKKQAWKKLSLHHRPAARVAVKIVAGANPSGNAGPPMALPRPPWHRVHPTAPATETSPAKCFDPREC